MNNQVPNNNVNPDPNLNTGVNPINEPINNTNNITGAQSLGSIEQPVSAPVTPTETLDAPTPVVEAPMPTPAADVPVPTPVVEAPMPVPAPVVEAPTLSADNIAPINNELPPVPEMPAANPGIDGLNPFPPLGDPMDPNVGQIPPEKPAKKKGMNKFAFIIIILALIGGVAYGVYYYLSLGQNNTGVVVKAVNMNMGDVIPTDITNYATFTGIESSTCTIDKSMIDATKAGSYDFKIICSGKEYMGKVNVIDNTPLEIDLVTVNKVVGDTATADEFVESCSKEDCTYTFGANTDITELLSEVGSYKEVEIVVTSGGANQTIKAHLNVTEHEVEVFYKTSLETDNFLEYTGTKTITDRFAFANVNNENLFLGVATREFTYEFTNQDEYDAAKELYEGKTEFDGITGELMFDDETKTINIIVVLTSETLDLEYKDTFPTDYDGIKDFYLSKGYVGSIENP